MLQELAVKRCAACEDVHSGLHARELLIVITVMQWGLGCGAAEEVVPTPSEVVSAPTGDPLLARARASFVGGQIDGEIVAAIRGSSAPEHARAKRLLAVIAEPHSTASIEVASESAVPIVPPPIPVAAGIPTSAVVAATPVPTPTPSPTMPTLATASNATKATSVPPTASTSSERSRPRLHRVALAPTRGGATLSFAASAGVVVGVVREPGRGLVRLVLDASAENAALRARPRVPGATVTDVRATGRSLIVTLELDPGWDLGSIEQTREGARVHIERP